MKILDPECPNLGKWNKIVLVSCIIALWVDYMLFFVPWVDAQKLQFTMDRKVAYSFCGVRSLIDVFYVFHIFLRFRTGFIAPDPLFLGDRLVKDSKAITKRYLQSYFMIDILSILPLPQVYNNLIYMSKSRTISRFEHCLLFPLTGSNCDCDPHCNKYGSDSLTDNPYHRPKPHKIPADGSFAQGGERNVWNGMEWCCYKFLPLYHCKSCKFPTNRISTYSIHLL